MNILRALQKKQSEQPNRVETPAAAANVVPFENNVRRANQLPELFAEKQLVIGAPPSSAFNGQSDSTIGKALHDVENMKTAGATLNAVNLTSATEKRLPDFASWSVERSASSRV